MKQIKEKILVDEAFFHELLHDIRHAKKSILLETYIFEDDKLGHKVLNSLCEAARRGVKVKLLIDGFGSQNWPLEMSYQLIASGGLVRIYHPLPWKLYHWKFSSHFIQSILKRFIYLFKVLNSRNHRKVCMIDRKIIYVGSANISENPIKLNKSIKWHDINVRIEGNTNELERAFHYAWYGITPKTRKNFFNKDIIYRLNNNRKKRKFLIKDLLFRINRSKERVWIMNPFFISHFSLMKALKNAVKRGVDVRIIFPSYSDVAIVPFITKYYYNYFFKHHLQLMEYPPTAVLHCKVIIIDDWYCIGTSNFNCRSLIHDLEVDVSLQNSLSQTQLETEIKNHFKISKPITGKQSLFTKVMGRLLILIKYWC